MRYRRFGWAILALPFPGPGYKTEKLFSDREVGRNFPRPLYTCPPLGRPGSHETLKGDCVNPDGNSDLPEMTTAEAAGMPGCLLQRKAQVGLVPT